MKRTLLILPFLLAACNTKTESPTAPTLTPPPASALSPESATREVSGAVTLITSTLLAEIKWPSLASHCCGTPPPVAMNFCLVYGFQGSSGVGTPQPFITAEATVGCDVTFVPGHTGFVDFDNSNSTDFAAFVNRITNGVDETINLCAISVEINSLLTLPTVCNGGSESGLLTGSNTQPDLTGSTVDFVRLVVNNVSIGSDLFTNRAEWDVTWQFWSEPPQQGIDALIDRVEALVDIGALNGGQGNALIAKLDAATKSLNQENTTAATNTLRAFINQVRGFIKAGVLSSEQGQPLIDGANSNIDQLNGR